MALDSDNVRVAVAGAFYSAPTTTAAPTASDSALTGFVDLGYVSADGIAESTDRTTNSIRAWQNGSLVREVVSEASFSVTLTLIETKEDVLELYFGATNVGGVFSIDPSQSGGRKSFVYDVIDGATVERTYIPAGEVTSVGTRTLAGGSEIGYTVTIMAYADSGATTYKKFFSILEA